MSESVLVVVAHPDDEVLGCGGTMARLAAEGRSVHVLHIADGESSRFGATTTAAQGKLDGRRVAAEAAAEILGAASCDILGLPDNRLDGLELLDVVKHIEVFIERYAPSLVITHHAGDVNVDHRIVHDAVLAACRPQPGHCVRELLFAEVPSSTEWRTTGSAEPFWPNWFVDVTPFLPAKLRALHAYAAELRAFPHPRSFEAVEALGRWRGATVGVAAAEAFVLGRKIIR